MSRYRTGRVNRWRWLFQVIVAVAVSFLFRQTCYSQEKRPLSARIRDVSERIVQDRARAVGQFWESVKGKTPIVEQIENDANHVLVTFLWKGNRKTTSVQLVGGRPGPNGHPMLRQLAGTNIWYVTQEMNLASRGSYAFRVNVPESESTDIEDLAVSYAKSPPKSDPNNSNRSMMFSVFELSHAPPQPWVKDDVTLRKGKISEHSIQSSCLDQTRSIVIYEPARKADDGSNNLVIFFDAAYYATSRFVPTTTILDNLIAANEISPTTAVFVRNLPQPGARERDLAFSESFAKFVADELLPWVQKRYPVSRDASRTIVCGVSLGGTAAAYCALHHSDVIGGVLCQSGSFALTPGYPVGKSLNYDTPTNWLAGEFSKRERLPLRFYLEVGLFERVALSYGADMVLEQRRLRDVLRAKGYSVIDSEYYGGHDYICHRGSLANGLIGLLKRKVDPGE